MAELPTSFNEKDHDNMNDYSVAPPGKYIGSIVKSEIVLTKKAKRANNPRLGQMLKLQWKVLNGKYKGKYFFTQINIINENPQAVEIGSKELATIMRACGVKGSLKDSEALHGIPCTLTVDIETSADYPDKNVIRLYEQATDNSIEEVIAAEQGGTEPAPTEEKPAAAKKRVWE